MENGIGLFLLLLLRRPVACKFEICLFNLATPAISFLNSVICAGVDLDRFPRKPPLLCYIIIINYIREETHSLCSKLKCMHRTNTKLICKCINHTIADFTRP